MYRRFLSTLFFSVFVVLICSGFFETTSGLNKKGGKFYEQKRYDSALESFRKAQVRQPDNPTVRYNVGTTLYQLDQFQEAEKHLETALQTAKTNEFKAVAWYNYGDTQYRLGQFDKAEEAYRNALDLNPNDKDAKYNLELLQQKKKIFEMKQNKRDQQKQNQSSSAQQPQQQGKGGQQQKDQQQSGAQSEQQPQDQQGQQEGQAGKGEEEKEDKELEEKGEETKQSESERPSEEEQRGGEQTQPESATQASMEQGEDQQKPREEQAQAEKPLLQGQMSKESALRILNALKESEQELQVLRRPKRQADYEPLKDW